MDEDQQNSFHTRVGETAQAAAMAAAAALSALASGLVLRVQELVALADEAGHIEISVHSTCVAELRYDTVTSTMSVTFTDGSEYDVPSVSIFSFLAFLNSPSKGA